MVDSLIFLSGLNRGSRGTSVVDSLSFQNRLQGGFRRTSVVDSEIEDKLIFPEPRPAPRLPLTLKLGF